MTVALRPWTHRLTHHEPIGRDSAARKGLSRRLVSGPRRQTFSYDARKPNVQIEQSAIRSLASGFVAAACMARARSVLLSQRGLTRTRAAWSHVRARRKSVVALTAGIAWLDGVRADARLRWVPRSYLQDWTDGVKLKSIAAVVFMYFTCLAPVVAFGQLTGQATAGVFGVPHFIAAAALGGVLYAVLAGQPMTMIGPTGLTFSFVTALYRLCDHFSLPFLGVYAWTGLWCSFFLALLSCGGACRFVGLVTRFTDDVFNGLIVLTFLVTAVRNIWIPFTLLGVDKTLPFIDASIAIGTFLVASLCAAARSGPYFGRKLRTLLGDFGPVVAIAAATLIARSPLVANVASVSGIAVPASFALGRPLLAPLFPGGGVPAWVPAASIFPAILLTLLFFLDHNITSRVVNSPANGLQKGATYNLDLLVLAFLVASLSILGLPWQVAATVQSLSHVRAMTADGGKVVETRATSVVVHMLIGCSFILIPLLRLIPASAISGLFLYLGVRMMRGNDFLARLPMLFLDSGSPRRGIMCNIEPNKVHAFTMLQAACLSVMWCMRSVPATALFFPSVILVLVFVRLRLAPRLFSKEELLELDEEVIE